MEFENLDTYTVDDFILDEEFAEIVLSNNEEELTKLRKNLPEKVEEIELAIKIVKGFKSTSFVQDESKKQMLWSHLLKRSKKQKRIQLYKYVATIFIIISVGSASLILFKTKPTEIVIGPPVVSSENALLVLTDGSSVEIESKQSTIEYSKDGAIMVNDTSDIAQEISQKGNNQLIVPFGKRSFITLSEGTKVWLNSGSKLIFPPVFRGNTRKVTLEGEGFFDVAHDSEKPFYVNTAAMQIKVYGTKFNVQAYHNEQLQSVVLVEGEVGVKAGESQNAKRFYLSPNQKAEILPGQKNVEVFNIENTEVYTAWVDGYLTFTNEKVTEVLKRVSRYYNVEIEVVLPAHIENIYGKLDLKDDLQRVLDGIAFISKTKYKKVENKYMFYE